MHGRSIINAKKNSALEAKERYKKVVASHRDNLMNEERQRQSDHSSELKSIWDTNKMEDFLMIATECENGFMAERNVRVATSAQVISRRQKIVPTLHQGEKDWFSLSTTLTIPKRPKWDYGTNPEALQAREKNDFVDWRRSLAQIEESTKVLMTPYEKNLDVWRQLWRVVERSDIVLEIVDARNPMTFRCVDLEKYIASLKIGNGHNKQFVLLLNKSDLLTQRQRKQWAKFFEKKKVKFFFFSAQENERKSQMLNSKTVSSLNIEKKNNSDEEEEANAFEEEDDDVFLSAESHDENDENVNAYVTKQVTRNKKEKKRRNNHRLHGVPTQFTNPFEFEQRRRKALEAAAADDAQSKLPSPASAEELARDARLARAKFPMSYDVLTPIDLLDQLTSLRSSLGINDFNTPMAIGMIGYPNVGKSSTINSILGEKRVTVSETPGKTKHFQTLNVPQERRIMLCDCPGLVFPSFAATRETMICDGVLPIDTIRDYVAPITVVCKRVPKGILEANCNVSLHKNNDIDLSTTLADRLLHAVARRKGYMTEHDKPNRARAAKEILKMFVNGQFVYVTPPECEDPEYGEFDGGHLDAALAILTQDTCGAVINHYNNNKNNNKAPVSISTNTNTSDTFDYSKGITKTVQFQEEAVGSDAEVECDLDTWEDISSADETRALSDDEENDWSSDEELEEKAMARELQKIKRTTLFYDRIKGIPPTKEELFNFENNMLAGMTIVEAAARDASRRKKTNPQAKVDNRVVINKQGLKELLIDSDDDIEEVVYYDPYAVNKNEGDRGVGGGNLNEIEGIQGQRGLIPAGGVVPDMSAREKRFSKRQMRRQAKKDGTNLPKNPNTQKVKISDLGV